MALMIAWLGEEWVSRTDQMLVNEGKRRIYTKV